MTLWHVADKAVIVARFAAPKDGDQTGRGSNSAEHQSKQSGLSASARSEKGVYLLIGDTEGDVLQDICLLVFERYVRNVYSVYHFSLHCGFL